ATGFVYTSSTNEEGLYRLAYMNPGDYEITFEGQGFKKLVHANIVVRSTETARVDAALEVGNVSESVEVSARAVLLDSETAAVGHLIAGTEVNRLPVLQQKAQTVMYYMPGVTSQKGFGHVAGQRSRAFNETM